MPAAMQSAPMVMMGGVSGCILALLFNFAVGVRVVKQRRTESPPKAMQDTAFQELLETAVAANNNLAKEAQGSMTRDPSNDNKKCAGGRVFTAHWANATETKCMAACGGNPSCVSMSAKWGNWCIGCSGPLDVTSDGAVAYTKVRFAIQDQNSTFCLGGATPLTTVTECREAASQLGEIAFWGDSNSDIHPKGCYVWDSNDAGQVRGIIFNRHAVGRADSHSAPVCNEAPTPDLYQIVIGRGSGASDGSRCGDLGARWGDSLTLSSVIGIPTSLSAKSMQKAAGCSCCDQQAALCDGQNCKTFTHAECSAKCSSAGSRLCTEAEVLNGAVANAGCYNNMMHVWTSTPGSQATQQNFAYMHNGKCGDAGYIGTGTMSSWHDCKHQCFVTGNCGYFAWKKNANLCVLYTATAGCPDDGTNLDYEAYRIYVEAPSPSMWSPSPRT